MAQRLFGRLYGGLKSAVCKPRYYCIETTDYSGYEYNDSFPRLTQLEFCGRPHMFAPKFNFITTYTAIQPRYDKSFLPNEFLRSSKKIVREVSNRIAKGDFEALKNLVTPDVFEEIKSNLPKFSVEQRRDLAINGEELVHSFLDRIYVKEDPEQSGTNFIEILTIHHSYKRLENLQLAKVSENLAAFMIHQNFNMSRIIGNETRIYVSNYRFLRKYYPTGEADNWIINGVQYQLVK